jgi:lysyl-tRNA synthetase class I
LAEDQVPKRRNELNLEKDLDKILDDYDNYKDLLNKTEFKNCNSSKNYVWGFPKKNPNVAKKYYSKKDKK